MMNYEPLRLSGSPAKSTKIVKGPSSPTKSISLDMEETSPIETDFLAGSGSARRTNFFDDSSSDEHEKRESLSLSLNDPRKMTSKSKKSDNFSCNEASYPGHTPDEYSYVCGSHGKTRTDAERSPTPVANIISDLHRSSGISSILVPSGEASKESLLDKNPQQPSRPGTGMETRGGPAGYDNNKFRISGVFEDDPSEALQTLDSKTDDRILGVHAITLQALLRDEEALQASASASTRCKSVSSDLAGVKTDPALTTSRADSAMLPVGFSSQQDSSPPQEKKKVLLIPPPIDTKAQPRKESSKPKTPYPFHHRKGNALFRPSPLSAPDDQSSPAAEPPSRQVVMEIRLRRREGVYAPRVSRISIPTSAELSRDQSQPNDKQSSAATPSSSSSSLTKRSKDAISSPGPSHSFTSDASLADALRTEYAHLAGLWPIRFFSARTLSRMDVFVSSAAGAAAIRPEHIDTARAELFRLVRRLKRGTKDTHWVNWCVRIGERVKAAAAGPAERSISVMRIGDAAALSANSLHNQRRWSTGTPRTPTPGGGFPVRIDGMGARRTPPSRASSGVFAGSSSATWDAANLMEGRGDRDTLRSTNNYRYSFLSPHSSTAVDATLPAAERGGPFSRDESLHAPDDAASDNQITALTVEFIESWSSARIALALLLVLLLALAGIALWTVLGKGIMAEGWQGQGARVGTGVLVGGVVLMLGWTLVGAWIGASWCVV